MPRTMLSRTMLFRRTTEPQAIEVSVDGEIYPIRLRHHHRARRYTLRIHAPTQEAVLTLPPSGSLRDARHFAERNGQWIATRLKRLAPATAFADGQDVPLRGEPHRITHCAERRGVAWTETAPDGTRRLCVTGASEHIDRRVRDFLIAEARRDLRAAVERHGAVIGVHPKRITLRDPCSRWGSCSAAGVLSFSWRLILAPPAVLDYLAAHEVAHLVEMNHSSAFWTLTARLTPHVAASRLWLEQHGHALHRYGAPRS